MRDYFQWKFGKKFEPLKISLSMKRCPDNQINASFIDISRIKWLVFLLRSSLFCTTSTVSSSEASADYRPTPGRTDRIQRETSKIMDINPSLQICSWIRLKSTKEWTHSLTAVPFVRGHRSVFPRTPRITCVYTRHPMFVTATSGVLTWLPAKLSKNGMRVKTSADRRSKIKLRV